VNWKDSELPEQVNAKPSSTNSASRMN